MLLKKRENVNDALTLLSKSLYALALVQTRGGNMYLNCDDHSLFVSYQGGSILQWQWKDHFILGPTRMERVGDDHKLRGESHWCFPNFGSAHVPLSQSGELLPKHGFLRQHTMTPARPTMDFARTSTRFAFLSTRIEVTPRFLWQSEIKTTHFAARDPDSHEFKLTSCLTVQNITESVISMPILPALHPYFSTKQGATILIGQREIHTGREAVFGPLVIERQDPINIRLSFGTVIMKPSDNCKWLVVWSDKPSSYICVEPIFCGKPGTFGTGEHETFLPEGKTVQCEIQFTFIPA